jgi:DNA-binding HxlR family transcriptional regulator
LEGLWTVAAGKRAARIPRSSSLQADIIARANKLNARQAAVLAELFAAGRLAVDDLDDLFPNVNRRTLQRDLKKLVEKGLLQEVGSGPTDPSRLYVPGKL